MRLTDFDTLTFDCYGTLIDWETGIFEGLRPLLERVEQTLTRDQVLEAHARHESSQQKYTPYRRYQELLPIVYKRLAEEWRVPYTLDDCMAYGRSIQNWPAFDDSAAALQYLKQHYKLVILSNVDNESFSYSNAKLKVEFDAIFTAASPRTRFFTRRKVSFTITSRRMSSDLRRAGSIAGMPKRGSARQWTRAPSRRSTFALTAWPNWWKPIATLWFNPRRTLTGRSRPGTGT
jgi:2-haloalkanoic acid dehalogenase type II